MKAIVKTSVPTSYQYSSILAFNLRNEKNAGGALIAWEEFETVAAAREFLKERAAYLYDGDKKEIASNLSADALEYDAATARILSGSDRSDFLDSIK